MTDMNAVAPIPQLLKRQDTSLNPPPLLNITVSGNCEVSSGKTTITHPPRFPGRAVSTAHRGRRTRGVAEPYVEKQKRDLTCSGSIGNDKNVTVMLIFSDWKLPPSVHRGGHHKRAETEK